MCNTPPRQREESSSPSGVSSLPSNRARSPSPRPGQPVYARSFAPLPIWRGSPIHARIYNPRRLAHHPGRQGASATSHKTRHSSPKVLNPLPKKLSALPSRVISCRPARVARLVLACKCLVCRLVYWYFSLSLPLCVRMCARTRVCVCVQEGKRGHYPRTEGRGGVVC